MIASKGSFTAKDGTGKSSEFISTDKGGGFYRYEKDSKGNIISTFLGTELNFANYLDEYNNKNKEKKSEVNIKSTSVPKKTK